MNVRRRDFLAGGAWLGAVAMTGGCTTEGSGVDKPVFSRFEAKGTRLPDVWSSLLKVPARYDCFNRKLEKLARHDCGTFDVELYEQANGPDLSQRVMLAVPHGCTNKIPAVVTPYYFPEGVLGFNPSDGSSVCGPELQRKDLVPYRSISFMADLVQRGYAVVSADAYHLTYAKANAPSDLWGKWRYVGERLTRDWPGWSGIGKLTFDTMLLVDVLCEDCRVDSNRIGIMGHSLGGKMAYYAGCLDSRIKVVVASDFGMGWTQSNWGDVWYYGEKLDMLRSQGCSHADILSLSGGKPFCLIAGKYDDADSGAILRSASGYEVCPGRLKMIRHGEGHRPPRWAVEEAYQFIDQYLKGGAS